MLKPCLLVSAAMLFVIAPASVSGRIAQEAATPAAQAPAPPAAAPVKGPMAPGAKNPVTPTTASLAEAKTVYERDCAFCHGENGNGKTDLTGYPPMPDWTDSKSLAARQDGELFNMIRVGDGKNPGMPGEDAGRAKDNVVWNMIDYIRSFAKAQAAAPADTASKPASPASNQ